MTEPTVDGPRYPRPRPVFALLGAIVLAAGMALAGWFVADGLVTSRAPLQTVTVKGLAERDVKADLGFWPIRFVATGPTLEETNAALQRSERAVREFLTSEGFAEDAISVQNIQVEDRLAGYNASNTRDDARFVLTEDLLVTTDNVDALGHAARAVTQLLSAGVVFSSDSYSAGPSFIFTRLNDFKGEMLTEATGRAREAAQKFAEESGANVGRIRSANQGVFQINPAVSIPNDRPDKQVNKKIRVVTTITYFLSD